MSVRTNVFLALSLSLATTGFGGEPQVIPQSAEENEDSLEQCLKHVVRWANAERDSAPPEKTVTLFMVTPVAID